MSRLLQKGKGVPTMSLVPAKPPTPDTLSPDSASPSPASFIIDLPPDPEDVAFLLSSLDQAHDPASFRAAFSTYVDPPPVLLCGILKVNVPRNMPTASSIYVALVGTEKEDHPIQVPVVKQVYSEKATCWEGIATWDAAVAALGPGEVVGLAAGSFEFPFTFAIPADVPPTFSVEYGTVAYTLTATIYSGHALWPITASTPVEVRRTFPARARPPKSPAMPATQIPPPASLAPPMTALNLGAGGFSRPAVPASKGSARPSSRRNDAQSSRADGSSRVSSRGGTRSVPSSPVSSSSRSRTRASSGSSRTGTTSAPSSPVPSASASSRAANGALSASSSRTGSSSAPSSPEPSASAPSSAPSSPSPSSPDLSSRDTTPPTSPGHDAPSASSTPDLPLILPGPMRIATRAPSIARSNSSPELRTQALNDAPGPSAGRPHPPGHGLHHHSHSTVTASDALHLPLAPTHLASASAHPPAMRPAMPRIVVNARMESFKGPTAGREFGYSVDVPRPILRADQFAKVVLTIESGTESVGSVRNVECHLIERQSYRYVIGSVSPPPPP
ncbi:hypothetical protein BDK51DRAFT_42877 [Blyttiomyces helicus]|uniref:Arrestin-like N-terminal domain-containing protein n=1 Tax=Blyttiomyces helicus TaxID=388810 RepID=A0A4P9WCA0_9FUNG|nr:hypothetical protein BDK51DRAFT_42877 [Blyttiomyces helicus]|eukprot:RKO89942.1 hypothetical protein BDK51DRAFT_42877 [Blyttiomyces helicus]